MRRANLRAESPASQRGFTTILAMFMIVLLAGIGLGLLQESMAAKVAVIHHATSMKALESAEIGTIRSEMELRSLTDLDGDGVVGQVDGTAGKGRFRVEVRPDTVSEDRWFLTAFGEHGQSRRRVEVGVRRWQNSEAVEALFALEDLTLSNVLTDAYDSRLGTYAGQVVNADTSGPYAQQGGSVGSNQDIYLDGTSVWVRGNAIPGPLHLTHRSGNPTVMGDETPRTVRWDREPAPEADFRAAMLANGNASIAPPGNGNTVRYNAKTMSLDIAGNTNAVLPGGTYFFQDVFIRGGSTVQFTGPTKIYVTGSLEISADSDFFAGTPADLRVYAHPYPLIGAKSTTADVKVNGGSTITWTLYAPGADLTIGGGNHFYGAAIAKNIKLSGTNSFHYDTALGEVGVLGAAHMERLFWRELDPPRR